MENAIITNSFGSKIDLIGVMSMVVEQMGLSHDVRESIKQELYQIKQNSQLASVIYAEHVGMVSTVNSLVEFKDDVAPKLDKVEDFTECLFNHADAKKKLENHIHRLTYRFTGDPTEVKDKLFHPALTRSCKGHITKSLNVSEFKRIKVSDVDVAKKLADHYMTAYQVDYVINKMIKTWQEQKRKGTLRNKVAIDLLDTYLNQESQRYADDLEKKLKAM